LEVALPGFRPEGPIRCQSGQRPGGAENNNDPEEGENADDSKKSAMAWLERVYAVVFARYLFYQPLTATVVRQETDPVGSSRAARRDPVVRRRRRLSRPVSVLGPKSFLALEIGDEDHLEKLPNVATLCQPSQRFAVGVPTRFGPGS